MGLLQANDFMIFEKTGKSVGNSKTTGESARIGRVKGQTTNVIGENTRNREGAMSERNYHLDKEKRERGKRKGERKKKERKKRKDGEEKKKGKRKERKRKKCRKGS